MLKWITKTTEKICSISEPQLVEKAKNGNAEAFGKLYLGYLDRIYRFIFFRVGCDQMLAEDLSQTVFYKAFQKIQAFQTQENGSIQAWFYRIAQNCIYDHFRFTKQSFSMDLAENIGECDLVLEKLMQEDKTKKLMKGLKSLPEEQRSVLMLRYIEECSYAEIASILDKQETAVRMISSRGVKKLKEIIL